MSSRTEAVLDLKKTWEEVLRKQAMMPVPPHPDFAPPQGPPPGGPMPPQGGSPMPPQGPPPGGPMPPQGGAPMPPGAEAAPPETGAPQGPPAVSSEMAAMMEKVIQAVEGQGQAFADYRKQQEDRMARLEAELAQDKAIREERKKLIHSIVPTL